MASCVKYYTFVEDLGKEVHDFSNDIIKVALTNTAPNASTHTTLSDITEISDGNGYTAGGTAVGSLSWSESGGTATLSGDDVVFTASGGAIAQFRYAVLYNDSSASDSLIAYWDYGSAVDVASGETFTTDFGASILTIA